MSPQCASQQAASQLSQISYKKSWLFFRTIKDDHETSHRRFDGRFPTSTLVAALKTFKLSVSRVNILS